MLVSLKHWSEFSVDYRDEFMIGKFFRLYCCPSVLAQSPPLGLETRCCAIKLLMQNRINLWSLMCILQCCHRSSFVIPPVYVWSFIRSLALLSITINFRRTNATEKGNIGSKYYAIILEAVVIFSPGLDHRAEPYKSLPASWLSFVTAGEHEKSLQQQRNIYRVKSPVSSKNAAARPPWPSKGPLSSEVNFLAHYARGFHAHGRGNMDRGWERGVGTRVASGARKHYAQSAPERYGSASRDRPGEPPRTVSPARFALNWWQYFFVDLPASNIECIYNLVDVVTKTHRCLIDLFFIHTYLLSYALNLVVLNTNGPITCICICRHFLGLSEL